MVVVSPREEEEEEDKKAQQRSVIFLCRMSLLCEFLIKAETSFFFLCLSKNRSTTRYKKGLSLKTSKDARGRREKKANARRRHARVESDEDGARETTRVVS